ncbi:MAG: YodL domain-containing protein [Lachnospiraceae bacterium]|nr:YodL domain-containing protein [Lachnospiraceae bacterium]
MSETFSVLLDSRSRLATGEPGGVWLPMPTTTEQLHEAMRSVGITADNPQDFFINGFSNTENYPFDIPLSVVQGSTIDELNYLGKLLEMQSDGDRDKFTAAVTLGEHAGSVKDLINLAQNLDCYWIYPAVRSEADYGYYLIDELDELELPEEAKRYFKYEEYGRDAVKKDRGQFTGQGYIYNNGNTFSQWYNGRETDIPQEYCVMSFPKPERPNPDRLEKDEAAPEQEEPQPGTQQEPPPQPRPVNPIILTADKPAEKLKEITDRLEQGITELFDSERYKEYLQVMSKFHNYSFNNTVLIAMQKPDASLIAGFNAWKNNFGRNVMRGEKGIRILAPSPYKIRQEVEKKDPQTGKTVIGADGKPVTETKEIQIPAYKVVAVFDVSQTEGRELPSIGANELTGDVEKYEDFFAALEKTSPVPMGFEKIEGTAHGYYHLEEKRIAIDEGMSELQNLKTAIHEIAHAKLHDIDLNAPKGEQGDRPDRRTREVQAESIAYTVCQHYGLDTSDYSFGYVAGWSSGRELAELKSSLETIRATAAEIINSIDGHFAELQKEREAAKQQEAEAENAPDLTAEPTVTILWSESSQLREGEVIPLSLANTLIAGLDEANLASPGYDKTAFRIDFVMNGIPDHYEGRQDLGDGDGSLVEHIEQYHTHYLNNEQWDNYLLQREGKEALEADKEHRAFLLNEFVPYLKLHCNLSEMERIATEALQNGDSLTSTEAAYHTAMQAYVSECRGLVNQGEYNLPPVPQLADFDAELQAYKEHVKEEIAQEAATAGMTVEEYAANGYEPYTAPEPGAAQEQEAAYRLDNGDYLYIQTCESGYDYTFYREDFSEIDGGQLDNPALSMLSARDEILALHERTDTEIETLDVGAFEQAQEAAQQEPGFLYKMEANPRSENSNDRFFLQAYEKEGNGRAIPRDVLFIGTPEQCRELLGKLEAGELTQEQVKELFAQAQEAAQTAEPQEPEKADTPAQEETAAEKSDTPGQEAQTDDRPLTDLQKKAVEIAGRYENLPLQDKIGIIAQAFGGTEGKIETSPCTGKWRGTSDISIKFDNGASLFIGNHRTPQAKTAKVQNEDVNAALVRYNPEIIAATKEAAVSALRKREAKDNEIAAQKGLKPYTLLNVEFNDGTDEKSGGYLGWYYVTLAVDGKICSHIETGLNYDILDGKVSENPTREDYFAAGALKETDVDYVFNNVGFSSTSDLYSLPVREDVRERAEKTLAQRKEEQTEKTAEPQTRTAEQPETSVTYYPINEAAAKRAKQAISYSDYKPGSATAEYRHYVDEAAELAARQKKRVDPSFHAKIDGLLDTYARKLAENMNKGYEITARVPSILITGGSNFPVRKKEKQNAAADKNMQEFNEIQGLLDKIRSTGMGGISADDPNAVEKLESKLAKLEQAQETMKAVNAYYRKNKTLDGCPHLSPEQIERLKTSMSGSYRANPKPFESYQLSNNNAEIHRLKDRIAALTRRKELGYVGWEFDGGRVEANTADNRLQIFFDEKPDKEIREELKGSGFRYAPSAEAWQRQLNDNAIYAADRIGCIQPLTGESPTELQKRARREAAAEKAAEPEQPQGAAQDTEPGDNPAPGTFCKVRQNPYSDSRENSHILQEYVSQENGMAKLGDILYMGTPEKCRELLGKLETGELTQGDVKELYAKAQEAEKTDALPDPTISVADMKEYGYQWDGMLPLRETAAAHLFEKEDMQIFRLYGDGGEGIIGSVDEIHDHAEKGGIFGVHKEDWIALCEYRDMKQELAGSEAAKEALREYGVKDTFSIYQLKDGDGMRDYHFEPYDRLQAAGLSVEAANYDLTYTAELTPGTSLEDIYTRFNIDHPADFKGHSLSVSDIVVLHQNGENTAHYVDSFGYKEVPEFLQEQTPQLTPDTRMTGEQIRTPRGSFSVTDMTAEQMKEAGYGLHHTSEDGKFLIMGNGTQAFAVAAGQPESTRTAGELEAKARNGEQISLAEYAAALKAEQEQGKGAKPGKKTEKKPSIRAQLKADKERAAQKKTAAKAKSQDLERS